MRSFLRLRLRLRSVSASLTLAFVASLGVAAELEPELGGVATMPKPGPHWFMTIGFMGGGGNLFNGDTGEMQGKINVSDYTSAVSFDQQRGMVYVPATYYSRGTYGVRTDLVVFYDLENLAPVAEVAVRC